MTTKQSEKLLPCPFCGSGDIGGAVGVISCYGCGAELDADPPRSTEEMATFWNTRASDDKGEASELAKEIARELHCLAHEMKPDTGNLVKLLQRCLSALSTEPDRVSISRECAKDVQQALEYANKHDPE